MSDESSVKSASSLARAVSYLDVPRSLLPPIWLEVAPRLAAPSVRRRRARAGVVARLPRTVVLVPGFLASDATTGVLATAIRDAGHRTHHARLKSMSGCSELLAAELVGRLEALVATGRDRVTLVGHS